MYLVTSPCPATLIYKIRHCKLVAYFSPPELKSAMQLTSLLRVALLSAIFSNGLTIPLICTNDNMFQVITDCSKSFTMTDQNKMKILTGMDPCQRIVRLVECLQIPLMKVQKECPMEIHMTLEGAMKQAQDQFNKNCNGTLEIKVN